MHGRLFIISAPSGAGKTSLVKAALERLRPEYRIEPVVTYTTKVPRHGDRQNTDYCFLDIDEFKRRIKERFFLEWSDAYGAYYGSPRSVIEGMAAGCSFIMVIDRVGTQQVIKQVPNAVLIWITVNNIQVLRDRLKSRGTETDEQIEFRLRRAQVEIDLEMQNRLYNYHVLNDNFEKSVDQLTAIITEILG